MRVALAATGISLALAGCVPTMELKDGADRERLLGVVRQFCQAERSPDPDDSAPLFADGVAGELDSILPQARHLTSVDPAPVCEPGRTWYRGGSRLFAEVRLKDRSDRLDFWRGTGMKIHDVLYGRSRRLAGRNVKSLRAALIAASAQVPSPPPPPDRECTPDYYHFAFLATDTKVYRHGQVVKITPSVDSSPYGTHELPLRCVGQWSVTGPAALAADRRSIAIAPDAPVGSTVRVSFTHAGKPVAAEFKVIGRDEIVLTGRYSQKSIAGCQVADAVRELEFNPGNRFSVTFYPLESYRDYWGTYSYDPATRRLRMTVEDGNFIPPGLDLEGEAELSDGRLVLKGMFLGERGAAPQADCTYIF